MSRWYGQDVKTIGIRMFELYYGMTPEDDIPVWARGLYWYISGQDDAQSDTYPWDFGLLHDWRPFV